MPTWLNTPSSSTRRPRRVRLGDEVVEVGVVSEPGIDPVVVGGVVTVGARGEDRPQRDAGRAQFDGVVEPVDEPTQPVFAWARRLLPAGKAPTKPRG